jgi:antitoxin CcdA
MRMQKKDLCEKSNPCRRPTLAGHPRRAAKIAGKRAINVSIDTAILDAAKALNINLSKTLEGALRERVEDVRIAKWQRDNKAFFDFANEYNEKYGTMAEAILDLNDQRVLS